MSEAKNIMNREDNFAKGYGRHTKRSVSFCYPKTK